jgi:hypothetical protein
MLPPGAFALRAALTKEPRPEGHATSLAERARSGGQAGLGGAPPERGPDPPSAAYARGYADGIAAYGTSSAPACDLKPFPRSPMGSCQCSRRTVSCRSALLHTASASG